MTMHQQILKQLKYKAWANMVSFASLKQLSVKELEKKRQTTFGNILSTINHIYVVDDIFKAHISRKKHGYTSRNTRQCPSLEKLEAQQSEIDQWYLQYAANLEDDDLDQVIEFEYIGGGEGAMSVLDILQHLVNHGSYHHGFVGDMMYQVPVIPPANDYTVFIREEYVG